MTNLIKKYKLEILIFVIFVVMHLPSLGHDIFNTDVWKWKARTYDFGTGVFTLDFEKTIQKYHPGVTLMWIGSFAVKVFNQYYETTDPSYLIGDNIDAIFSLHFLQKLFVVIFIALTVSIIFHLLKKHFGIKYALISIFILSFEPLYIALTKVFHLEGLMSTFMLASTLFIYDYLLEKKRKSLIFSSVFAGLALLTKTSALYLFPFTILILFLYNFRQKKEFTKSLVYSLKNTGIWLLGLSLICFLLWPALWVKPGEVLQTLYRGVSEVGVETDHVQIYMGKLVEDPGIGFYPVVLFARSSVILVLGLVGLIFVWKNLKVKEKDFILFLSIFFIFYLIQLTIPSKKLDRYILPSLMVLSLVSSVFYTYVIDRVKGKMRTLTLLIPMIALISYFTFQADYFAYYSPFVGGMKRGIYLLEPKWMIGSQEIQKHFSVVLNEGNYRVSKDESFEELVYTGKVGDILSIGFPEKYYTQIWPFLKEIGAWAVVKDLTPFAVHTKYFVYPVWEDTSYEEDRFGLEFTDTIKKMGVPIYNVYIRR